MVPVGPQVTQRDLARIQFVEGVETIVRARKMGRAGVPVNIAPGSIRPDGVHFENAGERLVHGGVIVEPLLEAVRVFHDRHHSVENGAPRDAGCVSLQGASDAA